MNKKLISLVLGGAVLVALILPKLPLFQTEAKNQSGASSRMQKTSVHVNVITPQLLRERVITTGTIMANEQVELRSEVSGKITSITFEEGSRVEKGALLVKTNDTELQAQLSKLDQRKTLAAAKEYRQRQLLEKQAISQETYENTLNDLNSLTADIQLIEARIEKAQIRAPFDGLIGLRYVSLGDYISPSTRIAALQDINPVKVDFSIPEKYAAVVASGDLIHFSVGGMDQTFQGRVYAVEPQINKDTRTVQIRARATNPEHVLLPGAFAEVELILNEISDALLIPTEALIPEFQGQKVYVVEGGKVVPKDVKTGIRTNNNIQITEGLQPQDTVVTRGILQLRPGAPVQITGFTE